MREGWEYKKLGEAQVVSGATPKTNVEEYWGEGHYWVTPAELNDTTVVIYDTERQITDKALEKIKLQLLPKGTVLLSSRAPIGKVAICGVDMYCNQGFKNCICSDAIYNKFLFYFLKDRKGYLNSLGRGATFKEISKSIVEKVEIPLPPMSVQLEIVSELDQINELIRLKKEQLKDYDKLAQSIFYEMFGDPVENDKGWEVKKLKGFSKIVTGNTPSRSVPEYYSGNFIEWIKSDNISDSCLYPTLAKECLSEVGARKGRLADKNEILVTCIAGSLSSIGTSCILNRKVAYNQQINAITDLTDVDVIYVRFWVKFAKKYIQEFATTGMKHIVTKGVFEAIPVPLPPLPLQQEFSSRISQIERQKAEVSNAIADLETLLASRMQYWFE